ncbi:serine/threonine-protein kinase ULK3-like [Anneissia japonica]|uniref:serine/threonine-protein kinase ULK3-like n=1 Tax=Anneissia japonica TaxID=1529436 RepID=UPI001425BB45|nr:serine/threonine-protein kinase ULK3-like [Anneissia japonica]
MAGLAPVPTLKGFILTEKLGSGTYATVYKGFRKVAHREVVAVKCILKKGLSKSSTENLLTEIEILKKVKHDHIVNLIDFQWDGHYIYLIMEYCSGGDLSKFLATKRALPERVVRRFLQQLASALQFLHSNSISHMDLKPHNLLLSNSYDPVLKVADFGFAQYVEREVNSESLRGSPLYMAPEIILKDTYDAKVDLWSVGVIMFECLFGKAPFASKSYGELADKIKSKEPIKIPSAIRISDICHDLMFRLLQRDPKQRINFEDFFNHKFVDLEHMPSPQCIDRAKLIVMEATQKDVEGDYKSAASLYCQALEYFLPAVHYEKNRAKKEALRSKVREYMKRAEELKQSFKPSAARPQTGNPKTGSNSFELDGLANGCPALKAALQTADQAEKLDEEENYQEAFSKYEDALGQLLLILQNESKGKQKELLQSEVMRFMTRAEEIKNYLEMKRLPLRQDSLNQSVMVSNDSDESTQCTIIFMVLQLNGL